MSQKADLETGIGQVEKERRETDKLLLEIAEKTTQIQEALRIDTAGLTALSSG